MGGRRALTAQESPGWRGRCDLNAAEELAQDAFLAALTDC